jgi:signal transduction histidine kinase
MSTRPGTAREHPAHPEAEQGDWLARQLRLDLHDGPVQYVCAAMMQLEVLNRALERGEANDPARAAAMRIGQFLECAAAELRGILGDMSPLNISGVDLRTLLGGLIYRHRMLTGTVVELEAAELPEPAPRVRMALYRVLQEALSNAYRHSGTTEVTVRLGSVGVPERQELWMLVEDHGRGFDPARVPPEGHFGLAGMRERLQAVDGVLEIRSAPGTGTTLRVSVGIT